MEKKTSKNIWLIIMGVLVIIEFIARACTIQKYTFSVVLGLVSLAFVALYGFVLYKKPHGNMLKFAMLLFSLTEILKSAYYLMSDYSNIVNVAVIIVCASICYCAGRLNRIDQNKILFPIIDILLLTHNIYCMLSFNYGGLVTALSFFQPFIDFTTIMIAYFVRYKEHKEAGLMDAPKK